MRSIVTAYDRLVDDPQALETYLHLVGDIDHGMVTSYRNAIRNADAQARRPRRNPGRCRRVTAATHCTVTLTVRQAR
ncbi:hypothetical protein [Streptomyces sp. NRRL S-350]|uniref:hypothetical protein n=1 Tax=Streptomyces sp. NRRL S-350 TaxID=1463902 RepID=UPI0004C29A7B|nr:hypothetical protein [Streptomyces sp. NRRL S-350]